MKLFYHVDAIPKIHAAFMMHTADINEAHRIFDQYMDNMDPSELKRWNTNSQEQIAKLADQLDAIDNEYSAVFNIPTFIYQPEKIQENDLRETFLKSCSIGYFIPFLLSMTKRDIEDDFYNVMVIVSGVGEYPDENFIFLGISIREVLEEFKVDSKNIPDNQASVIYPIVYNVLNGTIYSDLTENSITIKSCITHTSDNKEQVPNA